MIDGTFPPMTHIRGLTGDHPITWWVMLPWPPSKNGYWRAVQGRQVISKKAREYRERVREAVESAGLAPLPPTPCGVAIRLFCGTRMRYDPANYPSGILDALQHIGIVHDDTVFDIVSAYRGPVVPRRGKSARLAGLAEVGICQFG